jgi:hypothetical protein
MDTAKWNTFFPSMIKHPEHPFFFLASETFGVFDNHVDRGMIVTM